MKGEDGERARLECRECLPDPSDGSLTPQIGTSISLRAADVKKKNGKGFIYIACKIFIYVLCLRRIDL